MGFFVDDRDGHSSITPAKARMTGTPKHRVVCWSKEKRYGVELVDVALDRDRLTAEGVAIGWDPVPYRLEFSLETANRWVTERLYVTTRGESWDRTLDLQRSSAGAWTISASGAGAIDLQPPGGDEGRLSEALDCDLGLSPLTNSMPVLRHDLLRQEGSVDFLMAWVSVPGLSVHPVAQRYTTLGDDGDGRQRIEYRSIGRSFVSELIFDSDGLVVDYPHLAKSVEQGLATSR
jgi:hypothetical protein